LAVTRGASADPAPGNEQKRPPMPTTTFTVSTESDLDSAIQLVDEGGADAAADTAYTIDIAGPIDLGAGLPPVDLASGSSLTIAGTGGAQAETLGDGSEAGLVVSAGNVTVENLTIANAVAQQGSALEIGSRGTASGTTVRGSETVLAGGADSAATVGSGGVQQVYGSATGAVVASGGTQIVESGGTASGTVIDSGGIEIVAPDGSASGTVIQGGTLDLQASGVLAGSVAFAGGGTLEIDGTTMPAATISGFGTAGTIDLTGLAFSNAGSAVLTSGDVLQVSEDGQTAALQLDPAQSYAGHSFALASDGHGGTDVLDPVTPTLTTLVSFDGTDGANPHAGLLADAAGDLFGTTSAGGAGGGTAFEVLNTGGSYTLTTLVSFNPTNGSQPFAGLIADAAGDLLGTTEFGPGGGTVFELAKTAGGYAGTPTTLARPGGVPNGALLADAAGDLFGLTQEGGADGDGSVFELAKTAGGYASTPTTLVSFNGGNGQFPSRALLADAAGDLFGTTEGGGANNDGTVFEIAKTTGGYADTPTTLVSFDGATGANPVSSLIADAAGDLFGTTENGGAYGDGTVFELAKTAGGYASTPTTLVSFNGANGSQPLAGLIADAAGDLLGTTSAGGANGDGTVFELVNNGGGDYTLNTLVTFNGANGQKSFAAPLIADAAGDLFGTTYLGGANGKGTAFELSETGLVFTVPSVAAGGPYNGNENTAIALGRSG
jgi:autotransporter passenger strand-loop-strand repeat protein/uncharacterized repeat protein (TIGR03803 family)